MERQRKPSCAIAYLKHYDTSKLQEWWEFKKSPLYEALINEIKRRQRMLIEEVFILPVGKIEPKVLQNKGQIKGLAFIEDFMNDVERELDYRYQRDTAPGTGDEQN